MQCVQLEIPQYVYDQLGLHPNQIVTLSNSRDVSEIGTQEDVCAANNSNQQSFSEEPEVGDSASGGQAGDQLFEVPVDSHAAVIKAKTVNYELKPIFFASSSKTETESASYNFDVESAIDTKLSGNPISRKRHNNENDPRDEWGNIVYPRYCRTCGEYFEDSAKFFRHKRKCGVVKKTKTKDVYPKQCEKCNRTYATCNSFANHLKQRCLKFRTVAEKHYPWNCPLCARGYSNKRSYARHVKKCKDSVKGPNVMQHVSWDSGDPSTSESGVSAAFNYTDVSEYSGTASVGLKPTKSLSMQETGRSVSCVVVERIRPSVNRY